MISGAAASLQDPPILAPVQKRNNFSITAFKTRQGTLVQVHVVLARKTTTSLHFHRRVLFPPKEDSGNMTSLCRESLHTPFLKPHTPQSVSVTAGVKKT